MKPLQRPGVVSVEEAAIGLGVSPRTVRRWLQERRLAGHKIGGTWGVWWPERPPGLPGSSGTTPRVVRRRLRAVGERLIAVGNQAAGAQRRRGGVFLTWRRPESLQIIFALGRQSPTHGWAPHALGTKLPFWLQERSWWSRVLPLLRWYEQLRGWCHPRLLRVPGVGEVILAEIVRLETALDVLQGHQQAYLSVSGQPCGSGSSPDAVEREVHAESGEGEETVCW